MENPRYGRGRLLLRWHQEIILHRRRRPQSISRHNRGSSRRRGSCSSAIAPNARARAAEVQNKINNDGGAPSLFDRAS